MVAILKDTAARLRVPYLHRAVGPGGSDQYTIRGPCNAVDMIAMSLVDGHIVTFQCVPDTYLTIFTAGGNEGARGHPGQRSDGSKMIVISEIDIIAIARVPHLDHRILIASDDTFAIGRPCHRVNTVGTTMIDGYSVTIGTPYMGNIIAYGSNQRAIGRIGNAIHLCYMSSIFEDIDTVTRFPQSYSGVLTATSTKSCK